MFQNKIILSGLLSVFFIFSALPTRAGYYKTIYVEDLQPEMVIVREFVSQPQQTIIIREDNALLNNRSFGDPVLNAVGLGTVMGGIIAGSVAYNHHSYRPRYVPHRPPVYRPHRR